MQQLDDQVNFTNAICAAKTVIAVEIFMDITLSGKALPEWVAVHISGGTVVLSAVKNPTVVVNLCVPLNIQRGQV